VNANAEERDPVEQLAEEFLARIRRGDQPEQLAYERAHPELAERIRRLFPTLLVMERLGAAPPVLDRSFPAGLARFGEYRILREVGRGGMGVVFEAVQESLGRHVALKVLPPALCRDKYLERFQREAKAAARLHHTNIVPVFGVGADAGMHFYAMQFIDGRGLDWALNEIRQARTADAGQDQRRAIVDSSLSGIAQSLHSGHFTANLRGIAGESMRGTAPLATITPVSSTITDPYFHTVARLGLQVAEALHYAHSQGVLHRDVKPSNLLLDSSGTVWVADFGLAKADDADDLTDTGDLVGTLRYMAPERLQGRGDARSDIYSLGVTLFELLALQPAFDAPERLRLMDLVARGAAPRLRSLVPGVPRDLEMIVNKAMAREPADRYVTAGELAADLDCFLSDLPVRARKIPAAERLVRWCRRHPSVAGLASTIVVLLAIGAVAGWWAAARLGFQVAAVVHAERITKDQLWEARLAQARAGRASRLPGQGFGSLEAIADAARIRPSRDLRNEAIACMALTDVRIEREWDAELETDRLEFSTGVTFDSTLEHYAATAADGTVSIRSTSDGALLAQFAGLGAPAEVLRFSPDGRYLAARYMGPQRQYRVWDWRAEKTVIERAQPSLYAASIDFLPDGNSIVVGADQELQTMALSNAHVRRTTKLDLAPGTLATCPTDGNLVAICPQSANKLRVVELSTGRAVASWNDLPAEMVAVAWHPDGAHLAASGLDGNLYLFDSISRTKPTSLRGHLLEARELAFSPDGSLLVSRGWDGTTRFWDSVDGHELLRVRGVSFLQFHKDGRRLAYRGYNSKRLGIWKLADRSICRVLHGSRGQAMMRYAGISFSPDNRLLATSAGEAVCLWDPPSGRLLGRVNTGMTTDVIFDPAGRYLFTVGKQGALAVPLSRSQNEQGVTWHADRPAPLMGWWRQQTGFQLDVDRAGERLTLVDRFKSVVVTPTPGRPGMPVFLRGHSQVSSAAISPDGRYVATGTSRGSNVKVWDAKLGRQERDLPVEGSAGVVFTPDGTRLLVLESEGVYRSYRVDTWECEWERRDGETGFTRGLRAALHPFGEVMAQTSDRVNLRLVSLETGEELAVLPVPESHNLVAYQFSPDGRFLAAETVKGAVQLWDLHHLRANLRELGLDWELPDRRRLTGYRGPTILNIVDDQ
jgi:serine/threonine protein kinase/WD40 repeat protein